MPDSTPKFQLDLHSSMILEDYCSKIPVYVRMKEVVSGAIRESLEENNIFVAAYESRIKTKDSLAGKLELKGSKYKGLEDLTDILGARIITFYNDEVDKIAAIIENLFEIDWENSVDKRKMHDLDSFGYMSLHYICRIPESLYRDPECPEINRIRFEVQMRSVLQHAWANLYHDTGYKTGVEIPKQYIRSLNRLAGLLELADEEISSVRKEITDYRRKVQSLVASGNFGEVPLNGDTFKSYINLEPFNKLNERIAAINQAEIVNSNMMPFLKVFLSLGCKSLGDIEDIRKEHSDDAFRLAVFQIGGTDLDIISSTVAVQNLCLVAAKAKGAGLMGFKWILDELYGESANNQLAAERILNQLQKLNIK